MTLTKKLFKKRKFRGNHFRSSELQSVNSEDNVATSSSAGPRPSYISSSSPSSISTPRPSSTENVTTVSSSSKKKLSYFSEPEA